MNFLKKNWILILIITLGAFLRINIDTFISGYNYDEFAIISLANLNPIEILKALAKEDFHAPLYYFICHIFLKLNEPYIYLRFLNIIFSLINIFVFYKIGKKLKNKQVGLFLALILSVNHLQISITNFIKFYCLSFLLVSMAILFLIDYLKNEKSRKWLILINFLICLSFTYGFIFVFLEYLILYFSKKEIKILKDLLVSLIGFLIYSPILFIQTKTALNAITSPHGDYPAVCFSSLYVLLNDYFSPLLNYSCNNDSVESLVLLYSFLDNSNDIISLLAFIFLSLIPVLIGIYGILKALKKQENKQLFCLGISFLVILIIFVSFEINGFIPIYFFPSGLALIILSIIGIFEIKNKIKYFLIGYLIFSQLIITNVYPLEKREFKTKPYGNIDNFIEKIDNSTPIVLFDVARFAKYYYKEKNIIPFDYEHLQGSHSRKIVGLVFGKEIEEKLNKKNIKEVIKPIIIQEKISNDFKNEIKKILFEKNKNSENLILIYNSNSTGFIQTQKEIENKLKKGYDYHLANTDNIKNILEKEDSKLNQNTLGEIIQSYITKKIVKEIENYYIPTKIEQYLPLELKKYEKRKEIKTDISSITELMEKRFSGWIFVTYEKR